MTLLPLVLAVRSDRIGRDAAIALAVWLAAAFTFFSMYYPGNSKFVSIQWAPLLLLIGLATEQLAAWPRAHRVVLALLAMLTVATVVLGFDLVRSQSRPDSNPHLSRARAIARVTQPDDLVVHLGTGDDRYQNVYARYFAGRRPLSLQECAAGTGGGESALRAIEAHVASAIGRGRVVVLDDAITHSPPTVFFERQHGIPEGSITRLLGAHGPVRIADDPASGPLWLLTR
jgi:hypothetical protein